MRADAIAYLASCVGVERARRSKFSSMPGAPPRIGKAVLEVREGLSKAHRYRRSEKGGPSVRRSSVRYYHVLFLALAGQT
jgi:hypothetical protein